MTCHEKNALETELYAAPAGFFRLMAGVMSVQVVPPSWVERTLSLVVPFCLPIAQPLAASFIWIYSMTTGMVDVGTKTGVAVGVISTLGVGVEDGTLVVGAATVFVDEIAVAAEIVFWTWVFIKIASLVT